jgi:membrane dipeptidase
MKETRMVPTTAAQLHAESIIIDGLNVSRWSEDVFRGWQRGGLTALNATLAVWQHFQGTIDEIATWHGYFRRHDDLLQPILTAEDILRAKATCRVGVIFGFQNATPIEDRLEYLSIFHALGVRVIQLAYNDRNYVGDGCLERNATGLSEFGVAVVQEMNRLGILIDLSHVGHRTSMEAIEMSAKPVAITHANPRSLCEHPRNKTDEELRAVAAKGGVVGATIYPRFLRRGSDATIEDVVDVVEHLAGLIGVDHVAIGTDFTEGQPDDFFRWTHTGKLKSRLNMPLELPVINPLGIRTAAEFPNITARLLARGISPIDVKKIMGDNWLRLFREVWS